MVAIADKRIFYALGIIYMFLVWLALANGFALAQAAPLLLLIVSVGFLKLEYLFFIATLIVPFSINFTETQLGFGMSLPSEPIIFGIMILIVIKLIYEGGMDVKIVRHPVSIFIILHLLWMFVTTCTSEMVLVSFKYSVARFCFVMVFFFYASQLFFKSQNITRFMWFYLATLIGVIAYTITNHALNFFTEPAAHVVMTPFYNDHTAYAAVLSLFIPVAISLTACREFTIPYRLLSFIVCIILIVAIVLSYTRAAWVGLAAALSSGLIFIFRVPTKLILSVAGTVAIYLVFNLSNIILTLETNREQSSSDFASHILSILNITTDPSNVERLNRWSCAIRMWHDKPYVGWGPGTYQFIYGPYQINSQRTVISTNVGNRGNAHSEYLQPLSEQGIPGTIFFAAIGIATVISASRFIIRSKSKKLRALAIGLLLGLITYFIHGFLNDFLDTEKLSVPFWGFIAGIVALDVYHRKEEDKAQLVVKS